MSSPLLPPHLREKIAQGQAILFLGAGATRGATGPGGEQAMDGNRLRDALADKFLGGALKDRSLTYVADICKSESSLSDVQLFISDIFAKLRPAPFHCLVPRFRWYAIVTTNYDLVIERAYDRADNPVQKLRPIIRDGDNFSQILSEIDSVPYLKLHGCLRNATDEHLPLILASEEYAKHRENRKRLFQHFHDWALEHPIIFCGYDLSDPNIAQILFDIGDDAQHRPQYAQVRPSISDIEQRHWSARRITPISATFEEFLNHLDTEIPEHERVLGLALTDSHPISRWTKRGAPSANLISYLENELTLITEDVASTPLRPRDFYSGLDSSWRFCSENFDIERRISDTVVLEAFLEQPLEPGPRFYVLLGHAGSGKSILLRRVAWQAAITHKKLAFYLEPGGMLRTDLLIELSNLTEEPFSIFLDDVLRSTSEVGAALPKLARYRLPCVLIGTSRTNEWNVYGEELNRLSIKTFELSDLNEREIHSLLDKLSQFNCLGVLGDIPESDRPKYLRVAAERQLLVALLEATHGRPLAEIVLDEFRNIVPAEARTLYLDVCTLNRFGVPVRAGLISRVSGIPFHAFQTRLIAPLEHVVQASFDAASRDYAYRACA